MAGSAFTRRGFLAGSAAGALLPRSTVRELTPVEREELDAETLAEAQTVFGLEFTVEERELMVRRLRGRAESLARLRQRSFDNGLAPFATFDPRLPGWRGPDRPAVFAPGRADPGPLPADEEDIAFATVGELGAWLRSGALTSAALTDLYLRRLKRHGPALNCVVTLTGEHAREQAARADRELAAGHDRGPLHGIPWGAKDLFDTAGVRTSWGARPYRDRVPGEDAFVVRRLDHAGAVLVAKLSLGALAMGDVWYGGTTRNPFNPERGSSGSSAGSAAATAAGLVAFSLGTETLGSIVSPCMRCGTTGLRPTFGRVARTGAMALSWSMDKIGPIVRSAADAILVLEALRGADPGDPNAVDRPLSFDARWKLEGRRLGYVPEWFEGRRASDGDRACLAAAREAGLELVPVELPREPMDTELRTILSAEAAAAFEELTLSDHDDLLVRQGRSAWPNAFRTAWFTSGVDLIQAMRHRRLVCERLREWFAGIDALLGPSYAGNVLLLTNASGHPSLTLRSGFRGRNPTGTTLVGHLDDEGMLVRIGMALEERLDVWRRRPSL